MDSTIDLPESEYIANGVTPATHRYDPKLDAFVPRHSGAEVAGRSLAANVGPMAAATAAFGPSAAIGAPGAEFGLPILTGLVGSGLAAWGAHKAQKKLAETIAPEWTARQEQAAAEGEAEHPNYALAGDLASMAVGNKFNPAGTAKLVDKLVTPGVKLAKDELLHLTAAGVGAGLQGGQQAYKDYSENGEVSPGRALAAGLGGASFGGPREALDFTPRVNTTKAISVADAVPNSPEIVAKPVRRSEKRIPPADAPVPESADTIREQLKLTIDPASTKAATLLVPGSPIPKVELPETIEFVQTKHGLVAFNKAKISREAIVSAGKGDNFDGQVLGMAAEAKPTMPDAVVVEVTKAGVPVQQELAAPTDVPAAIEAGNSSVPGGETVVKSPEEVLAGRVEAAKPEEVASTPSPEAGSDADFAHYYSGIPLPRFGPNHERGTPWFSSDVDVLARMGGPHAEIAGAVKAAQHNAREMSAEFGNSAIKTLSKLSANEKSSLYDHLLNEERAGTLMATNFTPKMQAAYDAVRKMYRDIGLARQQLGMKVANRKGGIDPSGIYRIMSPEVREVLTTRQGTPEWQKLKKDFIDEQIARGIDPAIAEKKFVDYAGRGGLDAENNKLTIDEFKALREAEGIKLPKSWVDPDLGRATETYLRRASKDLSSFKNLETDPRIRALTGQEVTPGVDSLGADPLVRGALSGFLGGGYELPTPVGGAFKDAGRLVNAAIMSNPVSRILDAGTTPFKLLPYVPIKELPGLVASLRDTAAAISRASATGFNRPHNFGSQILGVTGNTLGRLGQLLMTGSGAEGLEHLGRGLAQVMGEHIAEINYGLAVKGDKTARLFMDNLGSDWHALGQQADGLVKLGSRVGQLAQGSYDASNLPTWARGSSLQAYMPMMKWSVEQANNFRKLAWEPFVQHGDARPLVATLISGLLGGAALSEVREMLNGKKAYEATIKELGAAQDPERAKEALFSKLAAYAQITGTGGVVTSLAKTVFDKASGKPASGVNNPTMGAAGDVTTRIIAAVNAINSGEKLGDVLGALTKDLAQHNFGLARFGMDVADRMSNDPAVQRQVADQGMRRDYHMYQNLSGQPRRTYAPIVSYANLGQKQLDQALPGQIGQILPGLLQQTLARNAGNPLGLRRDLRSLAAQGNPGIGPSPSNMPELASYAQYLGATQGPQAARQVSRELIRRQLESELKRSLVPRVP